MIRAPNARCVLPSEGLRRTNGRTDTRQMHYHFPLGRSQGTRNKLSKVRQQLDGPGRLFLHSFISPQNGSKKTEQKQDLTKLNETK